MSALHRKRPDCWAHAKGRERPTENIGSEAQSEFGAVVRNVVNAFRGARIDETMARRTKLFFQSREISQKQVERTVLA
jgi:hypothetical protein